MFKCVSSLLNGSNAPIWQTMKSVVGNASEGALYANFPSVANVTGVRIQILKVNNGRWFGDKNPLPTVDASGAILPGGNGASLQAMLYELEAYGPASQ